MSTTLHLTVQEYDRMIEIGAFDRIDRRIELIRGELREKSPAGPIHDSIIQYLTMWSCRNAPKCGAVVRVQSGLDLSELESRPKPDLLWAEDQRGANGFTCLLPGRCSRRT